MSSFRRSHEPDSQQARARGTTPDEFRRFIAAESAKWRRIVEASGAKID
ncbi:MAG TPA: hypothetical protein VMU46_06970 [Burkholderiales bacterium]|nr:hypothetical protein [Burkholderiales bacterium]